MGISDQEKRNAWLSALTAAIAANGADIPEDLSDERELDDYVTEVIEPAAAVADAALDLYEDRFGGKPKRKRNRRGGEDEEE